MAHTPELRFGTGGLAAEFDLSNLAGLLNLELIQVQRVGRQNEVLASWLWLKKFSVWAIYCKLSPRAVVAQTISHVAPVEV